MNFTVGILQTLVKLMWVEILTTDPGMLVKKVLTSNETKVSSGFVERCLIFWIKSVLSLTGNEVLPQ